jgi:hypothetical protein
MKRYNHQIAPLLTALIGAAAFSIQSAFAQSPVVGPLQIVGNAVPPNSLPGNIAGLLLGSSSGYQWLQAYKSPLILNSLGGTTVGIGLTNPVWTLDVAGTIQGTGDGPNYVSPGVIGRATTEPGVEGISASGIGVYGQGGLMGVAASGKVYGIKANCTTPGGTAGSFQGNLVTQGNITYTGMLNHVSDARYKIDIQPLDTALNTVMRLRGVSYLYRRQAFPQNRFPEARQIGFVAQEVQSVLPQLVSKDHEGYLAVDYLQVAPVLVEAIKDQQKQIEELKRENHRIHMLERQIALLAARSANAQQVSRK